MALVMPKWKVIGARAYMDNEPGSEFYADIEPAAAQRAIDRGSIELVGEGMPRLDPARVSPPEPSEGPAAPSPLLALEPETED